MLKIRLIRFGRKHSPSYRLVVTDSRRAPQSGAYLESFGFYNPRKVGDKKEVLKSDFKLKADRINYWISRGAKLSGTAHNLLVSEGVIEGKKVDVSGSTKRKKKIVEKEAPILSPTESEEQNRESSISQPNQDDLGEIGKAKELEADKASAEETSAEEGAEKEVQAEEVPVEEKQPEEPKEKEEASPIEIEDEVKKTEKDKEKDKDEPEIEDRKKEESKDKKPKEEKKEEESKGKESKEEKKE